MLSTSQLSLQQVSLVSADKFPFSRIDSLSFEATSDGVRFTYPDVNGDPYRILKLTTPRADGAKYLSDPGSGGTVWRPVPNPTATKVLLVEGTKQHLVAALYAPDDFEVLGIQGCYGWSEGGYESPDLGAIGNRETVILFDADVTTNHRVHDAARGIADLLEARRIKVSFILAGAGSEGLDDLLARVDGDRERRMWLASRINEAGPLPKMKSELRTKSEQRMREKQASAQGKTLVSFSERTISDSFARNFHRNFRYDSSTSAWASYNGRKWNPSKGAVDAYGALHRHASDDMMFDAPVTVGSGVAEGALKLSASHPRLKVENAQWDVDPLLWNTPTATVDLRTLVAREHRSEDLITRMSDCDFVPGATAPMWDKFLAEVLPDPEVRGFLQRAAGMAMLGEVRDHVFLVLTGTGRNGKGVFVDVLQAAFGEYATGINPKMLSERKFDDHPTERMSLRGARLVVGQELSAGSTWNVAEVKTLTGGDRITGRGMRQDPVTFEPSHTLMVTTNHKPHIDGGEKAFWSRYREVQFPKSFEGDSQNVNLKRDIIERELPGVLNWILEGLRLYLSDGKLLYPEAVKRASEETQLDFDPLARFASEMIVKSPGAVTLSKDIYSSYTVWCEENDEVPTSSRKFRGEFRAATGFDEGPMRNGSPTFAGVTLRDAAVSETPVEPAALAPEFVETMIRESGIMAPPGSASESVTLEELARREGVRAARRSGRSSS